MSALTAEQWTDLVTTALLGTDRRPLADLDGAGEPTTALLHRAAAHRALTQTATALHSCPPGPLAPTDRLPLAPAPAQLLLGELLVRPEPAMVNCWLAICVQAGLGVAVDHWPRLADLAARSSAYDRVLLSQALGLRGVWLLKQNPRWARVASGGAAAAPAVTTAPPQSRGQLAGSAADQLLAERTRAAQREIERAFSADAAPPSTQEPHR